MDQPSVRVFAFGTFDGVHLGHRSFLTQAKALGNHLTVVVARDTNVRRRKTACLWSEAARVRLVQDLGIADEVRLGDTDESYTLLAKASIDVICLGYDQFRDKAVLNQVLAQAGKGQIRVVRAKALLPWIFRGRFLRSLGLLGRPATPGNVENHS